MGYLNNTTTSVDAILTKHGRQVLADGFALNITNFALSDDGVDYTLWNPADTSGSANYGRAIEGLPNVEAVTDDTAVMKYHLLTENRNTTFLPQVDLEGVSEKTIEEQGRTIVIAPKMINGPANDTFEFYVDDSSLLNVSGVSGGPSRSQASKGYTRQTGIKNPAVFTGKQMELGVGPTSTAGSVLVTIKSVKTGQIKTFRANWNANILRADKGKVNLNQTKNP